MLEDYICDNIGNCNFEEKAFALLKSFKLQATSAH